MSGNFINGIQVCIEGLLCFSRRDVSDGALEALGVVPADPFQCFPFDLADRFPRAEEFDDFGFDQADDAFGQGIVLAVPDASDGWVYASIRQPFGVFDRQVLTAPVAVMDQSIRF